MRETLQGIEPSRVEQACRDGFDGFGTLLGQVLGAGAWEGLLNNVPDAWEEEEALAQLADLFRRPAQSEHVWLLLSALEDQ